MTYEATLKTAIFSAEPVLQLLHKYTVVSLADIADVLDSLSHRTACRKLVQVGCRSSYSHCGRFYTLDELAYCRTPFLRIGECVKSSVGV